MKKTKTNSEHYFWGNACEAWHLVKSDKLSVIQELMLPNTEEQKHYHQYSEQFFYILKGQATFEIAANYIEVETGSSIHILPKVKHKIINNTKDALEFLVISQPATRGDRFE